ncbi:MAG TPA: M23 family metallopeptidase [Bryobacteraceae bacterium]|jgi:murein DD-endopeptidase MepM/ murein hydrolase activator NlpD
MLGFALGALCLAVVLWRTGNLRNAVAIAAPVATINAPAAPVSTDPAIPSWQKPMESAPVDVNALAAEAKKMPSPAVEPPPPLLHGDADRSIPDVAGPGPAHLSMPLGRVDPKKLSDTFEDTREGHKHEALDIPSPKGTPVLAVAEGNVAKLFTSKDGGLTVYQFDNTQTYCYYYAHLDRYAPGLTQGTLLRKGEVLGYVGTTGNASPKTPHLHFAIFRLNADKKWWQGTAIDPLPYFR